MVAAPVEASAICKRLPVKVEPEVGPWISMPIPEVNALVVSEAAVPIAVASDSTMPVPVCAPLKLIATPPVVLKLPVEATAIFKALAILAV